MELSGGGYLHVGVGREGEPSADSKLLIGTAR
jgi:hypothetical protein